MNTYVGIVLINETDPLSTDRYDSQVTIDCYLIPRVNLRGRLGNSCHAGETVLSCNNGPVNEHSSPPLYDSRREGDHKRHVGLDRIAHQDLP